MTASRERGVESTETAPSAFERWLLQRLCGVLGHPQIAFVLWNGEQVSAAPGAPRGRIHLRDRGILRAVLANPERAFGEGYMDGRIGLDGDLMDLLVLVFRASDRAPRWASWIKRLGSLVPAFNTLPRARRNVHHHYDLGNEFYALWLDEQLVYTCAYFARPEAGLEEAQRAKLDLVCRKLRLRAGESVLETGCGWGALALHMAEHCGVTVRAFNVSTEQIRYARDAARRRGLADRVEFVEDDYRNATGRYDAFVSVGMLEHVGRAHYPALGRVIDRALERHGRGLLHFIGHAQPIPMNPWLSRYIFPGAYIPALSEVLPLFEARKLEVMDVENLRRHYARTLEHWLERFEKANDRVAALYDERFVRMWRLYLASSIAAFRTGSTQLYQILFARAGHEALPWTRHDLYAGG